MRELEPELPWVFWFELAIFFLKTFSPVVNPSKKRRITGLYLLRDKFDSNTCGSLK
jgi:hypothetical protein